MLPRLSSRIRPISLSALAGIALAAAGCGSSSSSGTVASTTSTSAVSATTTTLSSSGDTTGSPSPRAVVTSAPGEVKKLLALAKPGTTITSQGTVPGWAPANGSAIPADPSHISGFGFVSQKGAGLQYLSFAVKDSSGKCAGGDLLANASGTRITGGKAITVPAKAPCTGDQVAKLAGHRS